MANAFLGFKFKRKVSGHSRDVRQRRRDTKILNLSRPGFVYLIRVNSVELMFGDIGKCEFMRLDLAFS